MKNILKLGIISTLLLSTPAIAREGHNRPYGRDYGYGQHTSHDRHYKPHRRHNNDGVVYGIISGFILGTIISESRETRETTTVYEEQEYYCEETKFLKNHKLVKRTRCYPVD